MRVFKFATLVAGILCLLAAAGPDWGFFAHRRINRLAVFTLPPEVMPYFRPGADYLAEHAVDPDKRRYAAEQEAVRHYIDLDHWPERPPRRYTDARLRYGRLEVVTEADTVTYRFDTLVGNYFDGQVLLTSESSTIDLPVADYRDLWYDGGDSLRRALFPQATAVVTTDDFSPHGILPYHLQRHHRWLTEAFVAGDRARAWQLAAELGHYIADAHVPLHTTENYNGQLTGQTGIHAFWESRLPELFADERYDYFVGPAEYIADPETYYWNIVLESHALVDSVLHSERRLRQTYPADRQNCFEERLGQQVRVPCAEFAAEWSARMEGMVEDRFQAAVRAVGSAWYSAWVDAGQPVVDGAVLPVVDTLPPTYAAPAPDVRPHE